MESNVKTDFENDNDEIILNILSETRSTMQKHIGCMNEVAKKAPENILAIENRNPGTQTIDDINNSNMYTMSSSMELKVVQFQEKLIELNTKMQYAGPSRFGEFMANLNAEREFYKSVRRKVRGIVNVATKLCERRNEAMLSYPKIEEGYLKSRIMQLFESEFETDDQSDDEIDNTDSPKTN